jgi:SAM-dependent methyltransferase
MTDWISYWDSKPPIYVNARHREAHYQLIADDIARYIPSPDAAVLDYGCGEALFADRIVAKAKRLILVEAAPGVRATLARRFAREAKVSVLSPDDLAALPYGSLDLIVMHSVAQYLPPPTLDDLLARFRRLLAPGGRLIIGDVIPPDDSLFMDATALLRFGAANGFLGAAILGLVRTALSDYPRLRARLGVTRYAAAAMIARLQAAGFSAERAPRNIGHNQARMTFIARPT